MTDIRFTIVTDTIDVALRDLFGCARTNCPPFILVTDRVADVAAIPNGMKCRGFWASAYNATPLEQAWRERRARGGIDDINAADEARILAWLDKRAARAASALSAVTPSSAPAAPVLSQRWT